MAGKGRKGQRQVSGSNGSGGTKGSNGSGGAKGPVPPVVASAPAVDFPARLSLPTYGTAVGFSAGVGRLYALDSGQAFAFERGGARTSFGSFDSYVRAIAVSRTAALVAITSGSGVSLWGADGKRVAKTAMTAGTEVAGCVAFSDDGALFAVGTGHLNSKKTTIELFASSGKRVRVLVDDVGFGVSQLCFSSDGKHVITLRGDPSAGSGAIFERWPVAGGAPARSRIPGIFGADSLAQAGGVVVASSRKGVTLLSEAGRAKWKNKLEAERAAIAPDGSAIVAGKGRDISVLSPAGEVTRVIKRKSTNQVRSLAISEDGWLAVGTDGAVEMYPLDEKKQAPTKSKGPVPTRPPARAKPGTAGTIADSWRRLETWFGAHAADLLKELEPGVSQKELAAAEKKLGYALPPDLKASLAIHDGDDEAGVIGGWSLLAVRAIVSEATMMRGLLEKGTFSKARSDPHPRISSAWWSVGWIPLASSGSGDLFCLDQDPGPKGKPGQIILFRHDDGQRLLIAESLRDWLAAIARDLEAGVYEYLPEGRSWSNDAFLESSLEGRS
jgi:cell wall assembly regulator SMI1